jgi:hypothetical protein
VTNTTPHNEPAIGQKDWPFAVCHIPKTWGRDRSIFHESTIKDFLYTAVSFAGTDELPGWVSFWSHCVDKTNPDDNYRIIGAYLPPATAIAIANILMAAAHEVLDQESRKA